MWGAGLALMTGGFYFALSLFRQFDLLEQTVPAYEFALFLFLVNGLTTVSCSRLQDMAQHGCQTVLWLVLVIPSAFSVHVLFWVGMALTVRIGFSIIHRYVQRIHFYR